MADVRRVPPGRAGRLWLRGRLRTAERGVALLDRKLRILRAEQERLRELARRTEADWYARCREADRWLLRAALLGGQRSIRLATPREPAEVTLRWAGMMGVRYAVDPLCRMPDLASGAQGPGSAALIEATAAYRAALAAAVTHAAVEAANRTVFCVSLRNSRSCGACRVAQLGEVPDENMIWWNVGPALGKKVLLGRTFASMTRGARSLIRTCTCSPPRSCSTRHTTAGRRSAVAFRPSRLGPRSLSGSHPADGQ